MAILLTLAVAEGLYLRALRVLGGRGVRVPRSQILLWHAGIALWIAGLLLTTLLGMTFLFVQINEYVTLTGEGITPQAFSQGSIFYGLTGLHGAHVFIGLVLLLFTTIRAFRGHFTPEEHRGVEVPGIYWHFVDVMWVIVYTTVYII